MSVLNDYRKNRDSLVNETLLLAGDPLGERFDPDRAAEELNNSAMEFALRTQMIKEEINIRLLENVYEYDVRLLVENDGTLRAYGFPLRVGFNGKDSPAYTPVSLFAIDVAGYDSSVWYRNSVSPNKIAVSIPSSDGAELTDDDPYEGNIQVLYTALPEYMDDDNDYPDSKILTIYHQAFPNGAASRLLEEGDLEDLDMSIELEKDFERWIARAVSEEWKGQTPDYGGFRPA